MATDLAIAVGGFLTPSSPPVSSSRSEGTKQHRFGGGVCLVPPLHYQAVPTTSQGGASIAPECRTLPLVRTARSAKEEPEL